MSSRVTIYDVARRAGVSKSLVSLVLRDSPRVSDEKRAAVLSAIAELGYQPNRLAAGLAGSRTKSIGVVIDDFRNLWFVELLEGLKEGLAGTGYSLSVADLPLNAHIDLDAVSAFQSLRVDGLVIAAEPAGLLNRLGTTPHVIVGGRETDGSGITVANDDVTGGRLMTEHLLELGHRDICFITGSGEAARRRAEGYSQAMSAAGLAATVTDAGGTTEHHGHDAAEAVLQRHPLPTAIIGANDTMAIGVLGALHSRGLEAPRDVSVVGYDDSPPASYDIVSLTTVDDRGHDVGREAAMALLGAIAGTTEPAAEILVPPALVVRQSSGPAPSR
ncbi:LacI family DNA-binding transcriptional regulator [Paramicrobacterium sp. CJ85]|uniref:LacI family DNA-binding transcriptional regulator n=1 Tax=Paramicrobacterium sp. CJ85 TaxID=3445355 RepID=UPI003F5DBFA6